MTASLIDIVNILYRYCMSIIDIVNILYRYFEYIKFDRASSAWPLGQPIETWRSHCGRIDDQILLLVWASNTTTKTTSKTNTKTNTNTNTNVDSNIDLRPTSISLLAIEENKEGMGTYWKRTFALLYSFLSRKMKNSSLWKYKWSNKGGLAW